MEFDNGLEGLLQKSEELTANLNDGTDLPRVRRNLGQVEFHHFFIKKRICLDPECRKTTLVKDSSAWN